MIQPLSGNWYVCDPAKADCASQLTDEMCIDESMTGLNASFVRPVNAFCFHLWSLRQFAEMELFTGGEMRRFPLKVTGYSLARGK